MAAALPLTAVRPAETRECPPLAQAVEAFLVERDLAPTSVRQYRATLRLLVDQLGPDVDVDDIDERQLVAFLHDRWDHAGPATWNRQRTTLRSFFAYCTRQRWTTHDPSAATERRREHHDATRAIPRTHLESLWSNPAIPLRERTLWRLLYETAGRAQEILSLDLEDLDLANRRAVIVSKGGNRDFVHYQTGSARLLARLTAGRSTGPVFLTARRPAPARAPARVDLDPAGRARLSYRRAEELFAHHAGGRTLHQLRHSALTDLAAAGVPLPLLMAKGRLSSLRTLQRYARPGTEAVAALTASLDPERRRPR